jgi:hypothetical protein
MVHHLLERGVLRRADAPERNVRNDYDRAAVGEAALPRSVMRTFAQVCFDVWFVSSRTLRPKASQFGDKLLSETVRPTKILTSRNPEGCA